MPGAAALTGSGFSRGLSMREIVEKVVSILENSESFLVPVDWIVEKLNDGRERPLISEAPLLAFLRDDPRIKVFEKSDLGSAAEATWASSKEKIRSLGIYSGPRVMLNSRAPSKGEIVRFLLQKADQTYDALFKAWQIKPDGDQETEDQLLDALAKAQKLQRELRMIKSQQDTSVIKEH